MLDRHLFFTVFFLGIETNVKFTADIICYLFTIFMEVTSADYFELTKAM